ncbi:hypothetical protein GWI33_006388 [Rhynchophorus ferrugineus]|uniref:Uncharacterized protein n=1 Tax=Rhynchophorus ferrugineus TaxID=354439 RepID=A0A834IJ63_RHYFE|nr:hypothetical protein GWI33_006388 [Rhynchophorus ferrugineus]
MLTPSQRGSFKQISQLITFFTESFTWTLCVENSDKTSGAIVLFSGHDTEVEFLIVPKWGGAEIKGALYAVFLAK